MAARHPQQQPPAQQQQPPAGPTLNIPPIPVNLTVTIGQPPAQPPVQPAPQPQPAPMPTPVPAQAARQPVKKGAFATVLSAIPKKGPLRAIAACAFVVLVGFLVWRMVEYWKPREFRTPMDHTKVYNIAVGACYASYQEPLNPSAEGRTAIKTLGKAAVNMATLEQDHQHQMDVRNQNRADTAESHHHTETISAIDAGLGKVVFYNTTADQSGGDPVTISGSFGTICLKGGEFRELTLPPGKYQTQIRYASHPQFSGSYDFEVVGVVPRQMTAPDGTQFKCVSLGWL